MQNRLVAAILVATILGSCLIGFSDDGYDARLDSNHRYEYSESVPAGEFKIHRPGEAHDAEETLVWYPNNITGLSTMQFTIMLDNSFSTETITQLPHVPDTTYYALVVRRKPLASWVLTLPFTPKHALWEAIHS